MRALQRPRRHRDAAGIRRAAVRARRSTPRPSSPRSCAPASWRCRRARPRRPMRSGCGRGPTLRLVVMPQAMRVIIPPLTSQYLNLTKNSSLAVAIGYPDLVQIFAGTVLNQTGQAVEVIAITMAVYLAISLVDLAAHELLQRARRAGGALSDGDAAPSTDAARLAFVRASRSSRCRRRWRDSGAIGWLRANLFSSAAQHRADAAVCVLLIVWLVPPLLKFLLIDAVWDGADRAACLATPARPRGRRLLGLRARAVRLLHLRLLSARRALARRRVLRRCSRSASAGWPGSTRRAAISARSISSSCCRSSSFVLLLGLAGARPAARVDRAVGRPAGHPRRRGGRHRRARCRSASCWRSAAARSMPAVRLFSVDLHRVRARRAADHGAVHGERDAAAVRAGRPGRRTSCCAR